MNERKEEKNCRPVATKPELINKYQIDFQCIPSMYGAWLQYSAWFRIFFCFCSLSYCGEWSDTFQSGIYMQWIVLIRFSFLEWITSHFSDGCFNIEIVHWHSRRENMKQSIHDTDWDSSSSVGVAAFDESINSFSRIFIFFFISPSKGNSFIFSYL